MPTYALADMLPDFGAPPPSLRPAQPAVQEPAPRPVRVLPEEELRSRVEAAVREAEAAVEARLAETQAQALAEIEARHAGELVRLRDELGERAGRVIAERLERMETDLVALTSAVVARMLGVSLTEDVKRHALDELRRSILAAVGDRDAARIRIRGPLFLYEALKPGLARFADGIEFTEEPGFDLAVSIDTSLFETRLGDWSTALSEVLA